MNILRTSYLDRLMRHRQNGLIKIVTGCRRCGKSYLLFRQFIPALKSEGTDDGHIIAIALDDRENKELRDPDNMLAFVKSKIGDSKTHYILLDEVQYLEEFEDVLNSFLHIENLEVYVTGSNSRLLSKDVITTFRGRGDEIRIHPLSFREYVSAFKGSIDEAWESFVLYGGMPFILSMQSDEDRAEYLKSLFEKIYVADILERYKVRNRNELDELLDILSSAVGSLTNPGKLSRSFKSIKNKAISDNTVRKYISHFEDAFLLSRASRYNIKGKRYINATCKYYFEDIGLRNARLGFRQTEESHLMENILYNDLLIRGYSVDVGVVEQNVQINKKNGKVQLEIDFVASKGAERFYIQLALNLDDAEKRSKELRPLQKVEDSFKKIIVVKEHRKPRPNEDGFIIVGIREFLLADSIS